VDTEALASVVVYGALQGK